MTYELMPSLTSGLAGENPYYSITGSITTDGAIGELAPSDILSWSWTSTWGSTVITAASSNEVDFADSTPPTATSSGIYLQWGTMTPQSIEDPGIRYSFIGFPQLGAIANGLEFVMETYVTNDDAYIEIPDGVHYHVTWDVLGPTTIYQNDPYDVSRVVSLTMPSPYLIAAVVPEPSSLTPAVFGPISLLFWSSRRRSRPV